MISLFWNKLIFRVCIYLQTTISSSNNYPLISFSPFILSFIFPSCCFTLVKTSAVMINRSINGRFHSLVSSL